MSYITFEYYSSLFTDVTDSAEFTRLETRAEREIDSDTHSRVKAFMSAYSTDTATDFESSVYDAIRITMCDIVNKLKAYDSDVSKSGITSVSNDGYSKSYKAQTQAEKAVEVYGIVSSGLSGTGMCGAL